MASYAYALTVDAVSQVSASGTVAEKFETTVLLATGASDVSLTLSTLTDPIYVIVVGAKGVSFKIGAGGTDAIGANPFGAFCDDDGLGETTILLSNSDAQDHEVKVFAGE